MLAEAAPLIRKQAINCTHFPLNGWNIKTRMLSFFRCLKFWCVLPRFTNPINLSVLLWNETPVVIYTLVKCINGILSNSAAILENIWILTGLLSTTFKTKFFKVDMRVNKHFNGFIASPCFLFQLICQQKTVHLVLPLNRPYLLHIWRSDEKVVRRSL